jgi:Domain of unknown function (DUF4129)
MAGQAWSAMAFFAMICMELSWVSLWFRLFMKPRQEIGYWHAFLVLGGILLTAFYTDEILIRRNTQIWTRRAVLAVMSLLLMLLALVALLRPAEWLDFNDVASRTVESFRNIEILIPAEFLIMAIALLMGWRGLSLVGRQLEPSMIQGGFRTGIMMLFFYGLIVRFEEVLPGTAFFVFLFSGLMAMGAGRIAMQSRLRGGKSIPFDRRWLFGLSLVCSAMVGLSYLVISWLKGRGLEQLYALYTWMVATLIWLVSPLLYLVAKIISWLGERLEYGILINSLLELFQRLRSIFFDFMDMIQQWFAFLESLIHWEIPPLKIPKAWALWGTILFLAIIILVTLKRHVFKRDTGEEEDLSNLDQPDLIDLLRVAIRKRLEQLFHQMEDVLKLGQARRLLAAARIRRIYVRLMKLSAQLGTSRPAARTPLEFLPDLKTLFPELPIELDTITQAYMRVRYGELPETIEEVQRVEYAWAQISTAGEEKWKQRRRSMRN